jgi:hypothetical protein
MLRDFLRNFFIRLSSRPQVRQRYAKAERLNQQRRWSPRTDVVIDWSRLVREPSACALAGTGLLALLFTRWKPVAGDNSRGFLGRGSVCSSLGAGIAK